MALSLSRSAFRTPEWRLPDASSLLNHLSCACARHCRINNSRSGSSSQEEELSATRADATAFRHCPTRWHSMVRLCCVLWFRIQTQEYRSTGCELSNCKKVSINHRRFAGNGNVGLGDRANCYRAVVHWTTSVYTLKSRAQFEWPRPESAAQKYEDFS